MFRKVTIGLSLGASLAIAACTTAPAPAVQASSATPTTDSATRTAETATRTTKTEVAANDPNKKICRREIATGSVMAKNVCRTRAEWARQSGGAAEKDLLDAQQRASGTVSGARGN